MIHYSISIPNPSDHFIEIEIRIGHLKKPIQHFYLPSWRPGRYELGNFSKNVRHWRALDKKGNKLPFKKTTKDCWEVDCGNSKEITIRYQYFANLLNAGSCWLDEDQLYLNGVHCLMYDINRISEACEVKLELPKSWKIACGMPETKKHVLAARDFHELIDCPFIASPSLQHKGYVVNKIEFHIWFQGTCKPNWERLITDFKRFTEEQLNLFGSFPSKDYHFLIQVLPYSFYHGVEHANSTVLALGPGYDLMNQTVYHELIGVACHELFHIWNIKTIRPKDMFPYRYQEENYSTLGYVYEGITTYYGDYLLGRCNVYSDEEVLAELSTRLQNHLDNAGRFNYAVSESSFDSWLDGYIPGIPVRKTSIYDEGSLIAMMLDLMIRQETEGKKSLDDFMRLMNTQFGNLKKGYVETDLLKSLKQLCGKDFNEFFEWYINHASSLDTKLNQLLEFIGCEIYCEKSPLYFEHHYGFKMIQEAGVSKVSKVYPWSVAHASGLCADDEIISINGFKVENNMDSWCRYFDEEPVHLQVFKNKRQHKIVLKPGKDKYYKRYRIVRITRPTKNQDYYFEKWMGR